MIAVCFTGLEVSQIDAEVDKTLRRLKELKEIQHMRDCIARSESLLTVIDDFTEDSLQFHT